MKIEELIKEYFKDKLASPSTFTKAIKLAPKEILNHCNLILKNNSNWLKISFVILGILKNNQLTKCKTCNKLMTWSNSHKTYCSKHCAQINKETILKKFNTNIERYGNKYPISLEYIQDKRKATNIEKYNTANPISLEYFKLKRKDTCIIKYGTKTPALNNLIKEKTKQICIEKYGVLYTSQIPLKIEKTKQTNILKYGVSAPAKNNIIKLKIQNTCLLRYGVSTIFKLLKNKQILLDKSWLYIKNFLEYVLPLFSKLLFKGRDFLYLWKCKKCGNIFKQKIYSTSYFLENQYIPRCLKCYPKILYYRSKKLLLVVNFCKQYYPNLIENNRTLIKPYELDILIPLIKLAIEFNGLYWHSLLNKCPLGFHLMKTLMCLKLGYRLIHIWLDLFDIDKNKFFNILKNIFLYKENILLLNRCDRSIYSTNQFLKYVILNPKIEKIYSYHILKVGFMLIT